MASGTKGLQVWCKKITQNYGEDVEIRNMTTSWKNGLAFCAILHHYRPDLIDFSSLSKENVFENNDMAFRIAEDELGIPALLDAEDMVALKVPDRLSMLTYVSQYYNYFKDKIPGHIETHRIPSKKRQATKSSESSATIAKRAMKETTAEDKEKSLKKGQTNPCCICGKSVYLMERFTAEGKLFHRVCVKCSICNVQLKTSTYEYDSTTDNFFCEKHFKSREELLKKRDEPEGQEISPFKTSLQNIPEDTPMKHEDGNSSGEDPTTPFQRNKPFVRKGIRPQSSPADMNWEKVNIIKSKEENQPSPLKSKEGAKSFLSTVINKKTNKETVQETDFSNPAYQQHLELSKFMNKINKDETWENNSRVVIGSETNPAEHHEINRVRTLSNVQLPTSSALSNQEIFKISEKEVIKQENNETKKKKLVLRKKKKKKDNEDNIEDTQTSSNTQQQNVKDSAISNNSENYENFDFASAYLSGVNKNDYENINDISATSNIKDKNVSENNLRIESKTKGVHKADLETTDQTFNNIKSVTDSKIGLRNFKKHNKSSRAESCIDLSAPVATEYIAIRSNLKKVKSHNNIAEESDKQNTIEEFHQMRTKLKKTDQILIDKNSDHEYDTGSSKDNADNNNTELFNFQSHLNKPNNDKNVPGNKNKVVQNNKTQILLKEPTFSTPTNRKDNVVNKKQENINPFLSASDSSPEIIRKSNNSKLDNTNPFLTSTEDLLFDSNDDFDDSNPFAEDARIERKDTLQKNEAKSAKEKLQHKNISAYSNPFMDSSSDEDVSVNDDKILKATSNNKPIPVARTRSKKREAPKRPERPPQIADKSPQLSGNNELTNMTRRNSGKKRQAPRPPRPPLKSQLEGVPIIDKNVEEMENGGEVVLLSRKAMPHNYCSIDSLARGVNLNSPNKQTQQTVETKPEKRQAPRRPVSAQLSYDEATILQSVALRDKQPKRDEIEQELKFLEVRQRELEMEGVVMEKKLRETMRGEPEEPYLIAWFELVNQKNQLLRRENELIYMCQEMDFLKAQRRAEFELRKIMTKPEKLRSPKDKKREEELIEQIVEFVTKRSHIVDRMDEERLREYEEDQEIMLMMEDQGLRSPSLETSTSEINESVEKKKKNKKEKKKKEKAIWKKKTM